MAYKNMTYEEYKEEYRKRCYKDAYVKARPKAFEKTFKEYEDLVKEDYDKGREPDSYGMVLLVD